MSFKLFVHERQLSKVRQSMISEMGKDIEIIDINGVSNLPQQVRGCPTLWANNDLIEGFSAINDFIMQQKRRQCVDPGPTETEHKPVLLSSEKTQQIVNDKEQPIDMSMLESIRSRYSE